MTDTDRYEVVGYGADVVPLCNDEVAYLRTQVRLLTDEVERLRLTDEEREAIERGIRLLDGIEEVSADAKLDTTAVSTLRGLLDRMQNST